jgi:hypothetical protein
MTMVSSPQFFFRGLFRPQDWSRREGIDSSRLLAESTVNQR